MQTTLVELGLGVLLFAVAAAWFFGRLFDGRRVSSASVYGLFIGAAYGLGPLLAWIFGGFQLPREAPLDQLGLAYAAVLTFLAGVIGAQWLATALGLVHGEATRKGTAREVVLPTAYREVLRLALRSSTTPLVVSLLFVIGITGVRLATTGIFVSGSATAEAMQGMPYWLVILSMLVHHVSYGLMLWAGATIWHGEGRKRALLVAIVAVLLVLLFFSGRRDLWIGVLFLAIPALFRARLPVGRLVVGGTLTAVVALFVLSPLFLSLRSVFLEGVRQGESIGVTDLAGTVNRAFEEDTDEAAARNQANLAARPLIIRFVGSIARAQLDGADHMRGEAFARSAYGAIPAVVLPGKYEITPSEQAIQHHYGLPVRDDNGTWIATALADFGLIGCFFYGLFVGLVLLGIDRAALLIAPRLPLLAAIFLATSLYLAIQVEAGSNPIFFHVRNLVFLMVVWVVARIFVPQLPPAPRIAGPASVPVPGLRLPQQGAGRRA